MSKKLRYTRQQLNIFEDSHRFKTVAKGRRFGFTHGVSNYCIEAMNADDIKVLWGDTVAGNIKRYITRYWMPALKSLFPKDHYYWDKTNNILHIGKSFCDFRSADRPENWEGYGYDLIVLNEAGIILKNPYLWGNAVRPMLMDNPKSQAIIGGVPKGKNLFWDLCSQNRDNWKHWTFTSYDNPLIKRSEVDELVSELRKIGGEAFVEQEIFAKFLESSEFQYIENEIIEQAFQRVYPRGVESGAAKVCGIDFARKRDRAVIAMRQGVTLKGFHVDHPGGSQWSVRFARKIVNVAINEFGADHIFMDEGESGGGVIDILDSWGYSHLITPIMFGSEPDNKALYLNKRVEMYAELRAWLTERGSLPRDSLYAQELRKDLESLSYGHSPRTGKLKLMPKSELARSPDLGDALALTFAAPVASANDMAFSQDPYENTNTSYVR